MEYNLSELKKKNVVNVEDGKNLGKITDVVINVPQFDVSAIIVSDKIKIFSGESYIVNVCCIEKVGDDTILVRLKPKTSCKKEEKQECPNEEGEE